MSLGPKTALLFLFSLASLTGQTKPRARDLGIPFEGSPGQWNAITDVAGIEVGHTKLIRGEGKLVVGTRPVRAGVTAITVTVRLESWRSPPL